MGEVVHNKRARDLVLDAIRADEHELVVRILTEPEQVSTQKAAKRDGFSNWIYTEKVIKK